MNILTLEGLVDVVVGVVVAVVGHTHKRSSE